MNEKSLRPAPDRGRRVQIAIGSAVVLLLVAVTVMVRRADERTNKVALDRAPKPVSFVLAEAMPYQPSRSYIGTLQARAEASVGPQLISAYVDAVLVRPGAGVKRGEVLATLDCRNASTQSRAIAMRVRQIAAGQQALEDEAARYQSLVDAGFVASNEAEQERAHSQEAQANLLAEEAQLANQSLQVDDCILRAPFDGEVATRTLDPGAFVRPGAAIVSIVDRGKVIVMVDAPEKDFELVAPGTAVTVNVVATGKELRSSIARRAPKADTRTRTVHFEIDLLDPQRELPVGTTARLHIDVGKPVPAVRVPLYAAAAKGEKASLFVLDGDVAHQKSLPLFGEANGQLYVDPSLGAGARVVSQGRELLSDGDKVSAAPELQPVAKRSSP
jgi:membrane fusion protein (multidrug efflux system)